MKKIELVKGIQSSAIGFGCASILGSIDARTAARAIDCAIDCGINHFDLARSYGYGEAESFASKIFKNKRDNLVLASKFGIKANWKAYLLKPVKPILRTLVRNNNEKNAANTGDETIQAKTLADHFHYRIPLSGREMMKSLEQSLKALNTDYLDYFFVHEPPDTLLNFNELAATALKLKEQGKIRAWGIAYMRHQEHLHIGYINHFDILQFNNSPGSAGYKRAVTNRSTEPNIFFSPIRGGSDAMSPTEKLTKLFDDFPQSVVLCSTFNEKHLKQNAGLVQH